MSIGKKQLQRLLKISAQLKENRYPNCKTLVEDFLKLDLENNMNIACSTTAIKNQTFFVLIFPENLFSEKNVLRACFFCLRYYTYIYL